MILTYTQSEKGVETFDTESSRVKHALNWIAEKVGATGWEVRPMVTMYTPNVPDTIGGKPGEIVSRHGLVFFAVPNAPETDYIDDGKIMLDLRGCVIGPATAAVDIVLQLGLPVNVVSIGQYTDPDADKPAPKDWEAQNSPMGAPYLNNPSMEGFYLHRGRGEAIGATWNGPSGATYRLEWKTFPPFGGCAAWRLLP